MSTLTTRVAGVRTRGKRVMVAEGLAAFRRLPVDPAVVLYESFAGNGALCHPEALFRALLPDPAYAHLRHVWVLDDPTRHPAIVQEFAGDPRVRFVVRRSPSYFRFLSTAGYLVNNATFPAEFSKRRGQVYLNTWHGTPIKAMGYDIPGGGPATRNIVRNFLQADYLLSASPFMTEQMYAIGYKLRNILPGVVVEAGSPRIDRQFAPRDGARRALLGERSSRPTRVALYAPTWRGDSFTEPIDDSSALAGRAQALADHLGPGWEVLLKVHQVIHRAVAGDVQLSSRLVDNDLPANLVLAGTDVLITDYSSIAVDHLATGRPVVFLLPDAADYQGSRGLYFDPESLPGPSHPDAEGAARSVMALAEGPRESDVWSSRREQWREMLCPREDGMASRRVIDLVFGGRTGGATVVDMSHDGRVRLLMYIGGMKSNGITTSALNLVRRIDHERYDVSVVFPHSESPDQVANIARIDPRVRQLPRIGGINGSKAVQAYRHLVQRSGVARRADRAPLKGLLGDEWSRCFGAASFDTIADFSGYSPFWDLLLLQGPAQRRVVWLHNDMVADSRREVGGRHPLRRGLESVFTTYRFFDGLVSVSPALRDVNRASLARFAPAERFTFAVNTIDTETVLGNAQPGLVGPDVGPSALVQDDEESPAATEWDLVQDLDRQAPGPPWVLPDDWARRTTFVAVGRLSSAKNFERLIRAFARVHDEHPDSGLLILGEGPERRSLEMLVGELALGDSVLLPGHQSNPYEFMARCDCFVMSSDHEGQPMVILEALVLGLPVITTRFSSVDSALPAGTGLVVPRTVEGVRDGMLAYLRGEVPAPAFDAESYNRTAMAQFYAAIDPQ
jgi:CDP-glycerol glycerophosphotransferase (TagB/SpsB family)/glycosyltransferase involved in cell wall biosynthesis